MHLHIAHLPPQVSKKDLDSLFGRFAKPQCIRTFKKRTRDGKVLHYAYINVDSEVAGKKLIRRYGNATLQGSQITVRPFVTRHIGNERRAFNWRCQSWQGPERRVCEQRMPNVEAGPLELTGSRKFWR